MWKFGRFDSTLQFLLEDLSSGIQTFPSRVTGYFERLTSHCSFQLRISQMGSTFKFNTRTILGISHNAFIQPLSHVYMDTIVFFERGRTNIFDLIQEILNRLLRSRTTLLYNFWVLPGTLYSVFWTQKRQFFKLNARNIEWIQLNWDQQAVFVEISSEFQYKHPRSRPEDHRYHRRDTWPQRVLGNTSKQRHVPGGSQGTCPGLSRHLTQYIQSFLVGHTVI